MKRSTVFSKPRLLIIVILLAFTATSVTAASPYSVPSFWMEDPLNPGQLAPAPGTPPDTAVDGYWWRDTTNQNTIADQYATDYLGQVLKPYSSSALTVWVYSSAEFPTNVVILEGTSSWLLIGTGGSVWGASHAKAALFEAAYQGKESLVGIVHRSTSPEDTWGVYPIWVNQIPEVPIYGEADSKPLLLKTAFHMGPYSAGDEGTLRRQRLSGTPLPGGPDGRLSTLSFAGLPQPYLLANQLISEPQNIDLDGIPITLIPARDGSLAVWTGYRPEQPQILITCDPLAKHFPDLYPLAGHGWSIDAYVAFLDNLRNVPNSWLEPAADSTARGVTPHTTPVQADFLIPSRTLPLSGETEIQDALQAQRDAVTYVHDQAVNMLKMDVPVEDAVAQIRLQEPLASHPYARDINSSVAAAVRGIYHEYAGWFGGNPLELTSTLGAAGQAQVMVDLAGGLENLIAAARAAELNARDQASAEKALLLAQAAYKATPDASDLMYTVKQIYAQALRKNGFMQKSDQVRNYFLSLAQALGPANRAPVVNNAVADFTVNEDDPDTVINLSGVFSDPDGNDLTYTAGSSVPALVSAAVDGATLTIDYQNDQNGVAVVSVTATDTLGASVADDFTVTVNPVNDAPWANGQDILVTAGTPRAITLDYGDVETTQENLTLQVTSQPAHGALSGTAPTLAYTAEAGYTGDDSFTYQVGDGELTVEATVSIQVVQTSIAGRVYDDANANGSPDDGEAGLGGVTLRLILADGSPTLEMTTDADGDYAFGSLLPGGYQVRQILLPGYVQTTPDPADITLTDGQAVAGIDFGAVYSADLKVSMTASVNSKTIIYAITLTNDGPADAVDAILTDALPDGVAFVSVISTKGNCSGGKTVNCSFGTLASGSSATVTLKVNRTNNKIAIVNTATVSATTFDIDKSDNSATTTVD